MNIVKLLTSTAFISILSLSQAYAAVEGTAYRTVNIKQVDVNRENFIKGTQDAKNTANIETIW